MEKRQFKGWRRVQYRTAARKWAEGQAIVISAAKCDPFPDDNVYEPFKGDSQVTFSTLIGIIRLTELDCATLRLWYWART